jgi:O-antigen/teichoic acid export membrane protein
MFGLAASAGPVIALLLGNQWSQSVPVLRILCIAGAFWPLQVMNYQAVIALGRSRLMFEIEAIKRIAGLIALVAVARWGLLAIAAVGIVYNVSGFAINARVAGTQIGYGFCRQMRDLAPTYLAGALMGCAVAALEGAIHYPAIIETPLLIASGAIAYLVLGLLLRLKAFEVARAALFARSPQKKTDDTDDTKPR